VAANSTVNSGSDLRVEEPSIKGVGVGIGVGFISAAQKHLDAHSGAAASAIGKGFQVTLRCSVERAGNVR